MEMKRRARWLVDGLLVAAYLLLMALVMPYLREFHTVQVFPSGLYNTMGQVVVMPGGSITQTVYRADGWTRSLPALLTVVLLPLVRRRPLVFAGTVTIGQLLIATVHASGDIRYAMLIAANLCLLAIALAWPRRTSAKAAVLIGAGGLISVAAFPIGASQLMPTHVVVVSLLTLVAWLIGSSTRERRAGAARQRADAAAQAVANERLRIARELHDMIAHSIGIIAIQAGMGNRVIGTQPEEARNALRAIEDTSRDTLSQLRRTLTALRHGENAETPTDPAPGLADLDKLVDSTKHAGVLAIVETAGMPLPLPGEIDLAAYRIIQESVTNVVRHSGARTCHVRIEYREASVAVTVSDDGHGVLGSGGTGFGLVGMRERVSLVNGTFRAGPRFGGGFLVSAMLPVPGFETRFGSAKPDPDTGTDTGSDADPFDPATGIGLPARAKLDRNTHSSAHTADTAHPAPDPNPAVTP
ncbi:signal transduction histidine kinase [Catenulispora sp. MAP12-49]